MIVVDSISKKFKLYRSPADRLKEIVSRKKYHTDFQALNHVSFSVADGETLGIIGQNGAGKSTLLKILTGVLLPDKGTISLDGKITGLLELGTGFNSEMTGVENIYMNATLLGMTREEIELKKDAIIDFTELGEFIYEQLKTYSSGMVMRLAFAVAIHAGPKCFVVDEALSVGDAYFQQKCMNRIKSFRESGGSIIFVSHDLNAVKMLCDKAMLLNGGTILEMGSPDTVVNGYNFLISKLNDQENRMKTAVHRDDRSYGTFDACIKRVSILGENSRSNVISSGENAVIAVEIDSFREIEDLTVGIVIRDKYGQDIFGTNTFHHKVSVRLEQNEYCRCLFKLPMNIGAGKYTLTAALHSKESHLDDCFHWADNIAAFEVAGNCGEYYVGVCKLYPEIEIAIRKQKVGDEREGGD
jgi:lipopolysaccharide transport system ATP-binding protein